jgi:hypothetical protein
VACFAELLVGSLSKGCRLVPLDNLEHPVYSWIREPPHASRRAWIRTLGASPRAGMESASASSRH